MSTYKSALAEAVKKSEGSDDTFVVMFEASDSRHASDMYHCTFVGAYGVVEKNACGVAKGGKVIRQIDNPHIRN